MPLREDLLAPIAGENPAGADLYYDKVFDQIKEARREDDESLPEGDMVLSQKKKADHRQVVKLAGDALAARSKDLRLAGWLAESQLRMEGKGSCPLHRAASGASADILAHALSDDRGGRRP
jgi:type VI secretion system protein ImpA